MVSLTLLIVFGDGARPLVLLVVYCVLPPPVTDGLVMGRVNEGMVALSKGGEGGREREGDRALR